MECKSMVDYEKLNERIQSQAEKAWDTASIEAWLRRMTENGIPKKALNLKDIITHRQ
jgi:hypothetical protein